MPTRPPPAEGPGWPWLPASPKPTTAPAPAGVAAAGAVPVRKGREDAARAVSPTASRGARRGAQGDAEGYTGFPFVIGRHHAPALRWDSRRGKRRRHGVSTYKGEGPRRGFSAT